MRPIILKLIALPCTLIFCSYCFTAYKLTKQRLDACKEVSRILLSNYDDLPQEKGALEAIFITKFLLYKLNGIKNPEERKTVEDFIKSNQIEAILVREKHCVSFEFRRRNPFLITWRAYYLIYHTPNNSRYGCPSSEAIKCRLMPCIIQKGSDCKGEEHIIKVQEVDKNWIFVTTKGIIGAPS